MKKKLILIGILVILTGASFCVSFILTQKTMTPDEEDLAAQAARRQPVDPQQKADANFMKGLASASRKPLKPKEQQLDELIREVRARIKQLDRRERELNEREKQLALAREQLKQQAESLEKLRMELIAAINPLRQAEKRLKRDKTLIRTQEIKRLKDTATMYGKMDPSNAARILLEMFKNKQQVAVAKIIRFMPEKTWAAIMDEMQEIEPASRIILQQLDVIVEDNAKTGT